MSSLTVSRIQRLRRFHRHLECATCGAQPGLACMRMPAPKSRLARIRSLNENPHLGRRRTNERCGEQDGGRWLSGCNLPPGHGGEWHYTRQAHQWRVG